MANAISKKKLDSVASMVAHAAEQLEMLGGVDVENPTPLIKYRQNITVPAQWVPVQYIRAENIGMIPVQNIEDLDKYITEVVNRVDGGDLDAAG